MHIFILEYSKDKQGCLKAAKHSTDILDQLDLTRSNIYKSKKFSTEKQRK